MGLHDSTQQVTMARRGGCGRWMACLATVIALSLTTGSETTDGMHVAESEGIPKQSIFLLSPRSGEVIDLHGGNNVVARVVVKISGAQGKPVRIEVDGNEWARLPEGSADQDNLVVEAGYSWPVGIHNIEVFWVEDEATEPRGVFMSSSAILVHDSSSRRLPQTMPGSPVWRCPLDFPEYQPAKSGEVVGFGGDRWHEYESCFKTWVEMYPGASAGHFELGKFAEASGDWRQAIEHYQSAIELGWRHPLEDRLGELQALMEDEMSEGDVECRWEASEEKRTTGWGLGPEEAGGGEECKKTGSGQQECETPRAELYLSVILMGRHDSTQFCQDPRDACMDRFRASILALVKLLCDSSLAEDSEIILVEYNACHASTHKQEGSCDEREDGYMSFGTALETLIDAPRREGGTPPVRIITIDEATHETLWNPMSFDLLEFVGKNAAARRARGQFLLFTNPDDIFTPEMIQSIAAKTLDHGVMYSTFRDSVGSHIPVGPSASARSILRYVHNNAVQVDVAVPRSSWPRASCMGGAQDDPPVVGEYGGLHDGAAGDFLLLSRSAMAHIRGYPQIPTNIFVDGTLLYTGAAHGFRQLVFGGQCVIYHQPHPRSYNTKGALFGFEGYQAIAKEMLSAGHKANMRDGDDTPNEEAPLSRFNTPDWGLRTTALLEKVYRSVCKS